MFRPSVGRHLKGTTECPSPDTTAQHPMAQYFDAWRDRRFYRPVLGLIVVLCLAGPARAQVPAEAAGGTRALGMGGAFTAVADDASATWWNPAGLPGTLIFDGVVDLGALNSVPDQPIEETSSAGQDRTF